MLKGIAASGGIAIGKAFIYQKSEAKVQRRTVQNIAAEQKRLDDAIDAAKRQLKAIYEKVKSELGEDKAEIFETHMFILDDPELIGGTKEKMQKENVNAEYALMSTAEKLAEIFKHMGNQYMAERATDILDASKRVINILEGNSNLSLSDIENPCIIVARDLAPSDTAKLDREKISGIVTETGGRTSHSAIIARSLGIPAVLGIDNATSYIKSGDLLIVDGYKGTVHINPDENLLKTYEAERKKDIEDKRLLLRYKDVESITADGKKVEINANVGGIEDVEEILKFGPDGIGLYRTEFLYMAKDELPSEEEQLAAYKSIVEKMKGKPVIIRTLDIGGDKDLPALGITKELNPFMGYRAIRLCLDRKDVFKTQLRALLRASAYGNLKIMFPMIANVQEVIRAKEILEECKVELARQGIEFNKNLKIGIMIEVPSAALISDILAKEVDFFSIGTNDLMQYTLAVDRMNQKVSYLYDFFDPAVLRLIKMTIDSAHKANKTVGMCGEMAGFVPLIPVLLGMGLDEFSMSPSSIISVRKLITGLKYSDCKLLADKILSMGSSDEIKKHLKAFKTSNYKI
ncbi:phosphoenolpyruvate--protein phosphotransferase [Caldanaerobius polysaccharolyticus]|uniref:phosphoenolpyruvate--protein phosphotransferase n=1 Tax=Caldanaerobius polysaccharolyticus TaxID=44256 RepID=UPI00047BE467|nr:phosphoenolpyruvate--protein phosphotransferase [Caldanaerobius polysaccharolyticus]